MSDNKLGSWVRRFLVEYLVGERNLTAIASKSSPSIASRLNRTRALL